MKKMILMICFLLLIGTLAACASISDQMQGQTKQNKTEASSEDTKEPSGDVPSANKETMEQTGYTTAVPSSYKTASDHPGAVTRLDYDSKDYVGSAQYGTGSVRNPGGFHSARFLPDRFQRQQFHETCKTSLAAYEGSAVHAARDFLVANNYKQEGDPAKAAAFLYSPYAF